MKMLVFFFSLICLSTTNAQYALNTSSASIILSDEKPEMKARLTNCGAEPGSGISLCSRKKIISELEKELNARFENTNKFEFTASVEFTISKTGEVTKVMIEAGKNSSIYEEDLLRTLRKSKWVPAKKDGKATEASMAFNLVFKMKK